MKIAAIAISPVLGGTPKSVDEAAAMAVKGVRQVVKTDESVAVVADHMGAAKKGLEAAAIRWHDGPNAGVNSADLIRQLEEERSEEHTSELQSLMRISYAVFCLKKKK